MTHFVENQMDWYRGRIDGLERQVESLEGIIDNLKDSECEIFGILNHLGCDISDKDKIPIYQLIGREFSKLQNKIRDLELNSNFFVGGVS